MLWEIVDNSIDEAMAGFATRVDVTLGRDGSVTVQDNGRGMPVDIHPTMGVSGVEVIYTKLHAGGKFDSGKLRLFRRPARRGRERGKRPEPVGGGGRVPRLSALAHPL